MSKFKVGDQVILKKDQLCPYNKDKATEYWDDLKEDKVYIISAVGEYSWSVNSPLACIRLAENNNGWIPEDKFELISTFSVGDLVYCHKLPTEFDWKITGCGNAPHKLEIGKIYKIKRITDKKNFNFENSTYAYPPTVFTKVDDWCVPCNRDMDDNDELLEWRRYIRNSKGVTWADPGFISSQGYHRHTSERKEPFMTYSEFLEWIYKPWKSLEPVKEEPIIPLLLLPEKWYVKCLHDMNDSPELKEWRGKTWVSSGVINHERVWNLRDYAVGTEISYDDFLKLVYNPWKKSQVTTDKVGHWYIPVTKENFEELNAYNNSCTDRWKRLSPGFLLLSKHPSDNSGYWTASESSFNQEYPKYLKITLEQFRAITGSKPIVKEVIPDKWAYQLEADDLELTQAWRITQKIPSAYDKKVFCEGDIIVPKWFDDSGYTGVPKSWVEEKGFTFISKELYRSIIKADLNKSNAQDQYSIGNTVKSEVVEKTPQSITYSYKVTPPDHIPSIITRRPKPKLLSTDVEELNVNVNII